MHTRYARAAVATVTEHNTCPPHSAPTATDGQTARPGFYGPLARWLWAAIAQWQSCSGRSGSLSESLMAERGSASGYRLRGR